MKNIINKLKFIIKKIMNLFKKYDNIDGKILKINDLILSANKPVLNEFSIVQKEAEFMIYPNPKSSNEFISNVVNHPYVEILNNAGELVLISNKSEINLSTLNEGKYSVIICINNYKN